ncbi:MAG TPA: DUF1549 and DUF1553 domain-containing protein [Bryobacteraceae bacterium]|nr:DUF1549 and DUF1553 domain-containing protein [Bryobacteraceae bacterium]
MRPESALLAVGLCARLAAQSLAATPDANDPFTPAQRKYWAFQAVRRVDPPPVRDANWAASPIDLFILAKLEAKGLKPSPPADRITLIRRLSFDLIGLPPSPEEVDAFVKDPSPDAYERVVDRLLASPHYGERWARHWLDLARYAESEGFKSDETRPNAWRYRDYVIKAFNQNKPYDRFIKEQIAGDELWPGDPEARVATAFNRHYPDESNARNLMQRRQEILDDITDTVGATFMALTYGCARCHTHKFDPILHSDYYRLQAFFANTAADDEIPMAGPEEAARYRAQKAVWQEKTKPIRDQIAALLEPKKQAMIKEFVDKYPPEIQAIIAKPPAERNPYEWQMYAKAKPYLSVDDDAAAKTLQGDAKVKYRQLVAELKQFADLDPGDPPVGIGMRDLSDTAPPTYRLAGGVWNARQEEVQPGFLSILDPYPAKITPPPGANTTGRRTALANWLARPDNPLTARVMVNRIWFYHFGQGIVDTPSDFGRMGQRPTHPELLDWMASEFVRTGWDIKRMHKLIVMSNTYRQSSRFNPDAAAQDPRNRLMWRFPRQRLDAESIRDASLAVAGLLNEKVGGPSVFPELPEGAAPPRGGWKVSDNPADRNRRSVYIFVRRNARYPMLEAFDMPDTHESCGRRNQTVTAPQAMELLNSKVSLEWAEAFAGRVLQASGDDRSAAVDAAYRLAYGRHPDGAEKDIVLTFLAKQQQLIARRIAAGEKIALPPALPSGYDRAAAAAMVDFCQMLLNSNEFVYIN